MASRIISGQMKNWAHLGGDGPFVQGLNSGRSHGADARLTRTADSEQRNGLWLITGFRDIMIIWFFFFIFFFRLLPTSFIMLSRFKASGKRAAASSFERQPQSLIAQPKAIKWGCAFTAGGGGKLGQNTPLHVPVIVYTAISSFTSRWRCRQIF